MATTVESISNDGGTTKKTGSLVFVPATRDLTFDTATAQSFSLNYKSLSFQSVYPGGANGGIILADDPEGSVSIVATGGVGFDFSAVGGGGAKPYLVPLPNRNVVVVDNVPPVANIFPTFNLADALGGAPVAGSTYRFYFEISAIYFLQQGTPPTDQSYSLVVQIGIGASPANYNISNLQLGAPIANNQNLGPYNAKTPSSLLGRSFTTNLYLDVVCPDPIVAGWDACNILGYNTGSSATPPVNSGIQPLSANIYLVRTTPP